jgi:hypothetical protein
MRLKSGSVGDPFKSLTTGKGDGVDIASSAIVCHFLKRDCICCQNNIVLPYTAVAETRQNRRGEQNQRFANLLANPRITDGPQG